MLVGAVPPPLFLFVSDVSKSYDYEIKVELNSFFTQKKKHTKHKKAIKKQKQQQQQQYPPPKKKHIGVA